MQREVEVQPPTALPRGPRRRIPWIAAAALLACTVLWTGCGTDEPPDPGAAPASAAKARIDSDADGAIRDWLLAVPARFAPFFVEAQAELIARSDPAIRFHVVHSEDRGRRELERRVRALDPKALARVSFHRVPRSVSPWVRDYYLAGRDDDGAQVAWLHHADHYKGGIGPWQSRDPADFTGAIPGLRAIQTSMRVDGGSVVADEARIFAARMPLREAQRHGEGGGLKRLQREAETLWGRPVTWMDVARAGPTAHCDLFLMPVGGGRAVLGSPAMARSLLPAVTPQERKRFVERIRALAEAEPGGGPPIRYERLLDDLVEDGTTPERVTAVEAVHEQLAGLDYETVRVPYLALDPRRNGLYLTLTYTNVVMDVRDGRRIVYLPVYGLRALDRAATAAWKGLGFDVVPIDSLGAAVHGGAVRCLSQVTRQ